MNQQNLLSKAKSIFENHSVDTLFATTDGLVFFDLSIASKHAESVVRDNEVVTITRKEAEEFTDLAGAGDEGNTGAGEPGEGAGKAGAGEESNTGAGEPVEGAGEAGAGEESNTGAGEPGEGAGKSGKKGKK